MSGREPSFSALDRWVRRRPWIADGLLAAALAVVLAPTSLSLVGSAQWPAAARGLVLGLLLAGHVAVAFRRTSPVAAYAACCLLMVVLVAAPDITGSRAVALAGAAVPPILLPSALVYPVVLYAVAAYSSRPWPLLALAGGVAGAVVVTLRLAHPADWLGGQAAPGGALWPLLALGALLAVVLAPWGLGRFRSVRAAYVAALEEREARAEEYRAAREEQAAQTERARIAREMHDVVAHSLSVMVRQAEGGRFAGAREPEAAIQALTTIAGTGREALSDMRAVLGALQEGTTHRDPQPTVEDIGALVDRVRAAGVTVQLETKGAAQALDRVSSLAAYRVVQEALTNIVKHAAAGAAVAVRLSWVEGGLDITIVDDGGSGDRPARSPGDGVPDSGGYGLVGMRERIALLGGRLAAGPQGSGSGAGFVVRAHVPAQAQAPAS